jgi:outer membrane protein TolC
MEQARIKVAENGVEFAEAQYHPGMSIDFSYGFRGADRGDLISAMVMLDLPLFTGKRQDKQLQSSQMELTAAKFNREDIKRGLLQKLDDNLAKFRRSNDRITLYETQLLPQAEQNTEASLSAYQSGVNTFSVLVRARLTELNSRLQHLALKVKRGQAHADLLYLAGEQ